MPKQLESTVSRDLELLNRYSIGVVSYNSSLYPPLFRELHDPPFSVFYRGSLPDPEKPLAGMVGTRSPSGDGALAAARIGAEFASAGIGVVSGLARGIDAFAHRGNAEAGGSSVAVLACGVERLYPRSNARLGGMLLERGGCILSEYPPGEEPLKYRFPQRNRLISGLSRSLLVVEAPAKSGALITADFALEQGRDVFVFSGSVSSRRGEGTVITSYSIHYTKLYERLDEASGPQVVERHSSKDSYAEAFLRYPSPCRRGGFALGSGTARARRRVYHANLHASGK